MDERTAAVYRHFWNLIMEGSHARERFEARRLGPYMSRTFVSLLNIDSTANWDLKLTFASLI